MAAKAGVATYILAGGESSRMGRDKAMIDIGGAPLIVRIAELVMPLTGDPVVIGPPDRYAHLKMRVVPDDVHGLGPLGGIATSLRDSQQPWNLILGCDLPLLTVEWLQYLINRALVSRADAVLPQNAAGLEPLCAMYRTRCATTVRAAIERDVRKVTDGLANLDVVRIEPREWGVFDADGHLFKNLNSPKDIEEIAALLERKYGKAAMQ
jgi:molybdenum cofactor guanylyltransferase